MKKSETIILAIIFVSFIIGVYFYPQMPEKIASHWNAQGQANGYMPKFWGLFFMPLISAGVLLLFILIPRMDPLKANIEKFRKYYDGFAMVVILFLFYVYILTIFWNMGARFNMTALLSPALGALFCYSGILTENAKRNWFIGIRTPWTLSNEKVWEKTHKIGGKLLEAAGVIAFAGVFFQNRAIVFVLVPIILVAIYTIVYSYIEYQKEIKQ